MSSTDVGFHEADSIKLVYPVLSTIQNTRFTYDFENFFHPFTAELIERLNAGSIRETLDPAWQQDLTDPFFNREFTVGKNLVEVVSHPKEIDVLYGPYAGYNWELFFHVPFTIAVHLSKNQRYAEAQRWFHLIFDPTSNDETVDPPARYWRFLRFRQAADVQQIDDLLTLLSKPDDECTAAQKALKQLIMKGYQGILDEPFKPHVVARTRTVAYQYAVVMKYLDNLIAWGDSLFMQDTIESINEATQRYVLAANILGHRPQDVPPRGVPPARSFADLKAAGLDALGNALVELEAQFPFNLALPSAQNGSKEDPSGPLFGIGRTLYFCVPKNDKLLGYWDTVGDRLFKLRHCMNIQGVVRRLALYDPPIDPGMLVKATAAGIDIGAIVGGLNYPVGPVRGQVILQKALELCAEVRNMGASLLAALEKRDAEQLALLRQGHEIRIQQLAQEVRFLQWKQAEASTEALMRTRASALERYRFYRRLVGQATDGSAPETLPLDRQQLTEENFDEAYASLVGQYDKTVPVADYARLALAGGSSPATQSGASGTGNLYLNRNEDAELNVHLPTARDARLAASVVNTIGTILTFIPEFNVNLHFWGMGASSKVFGGSKLSDASKIAAEILQMVSAYEADQAGMAARTASYERRADEWIHQGNLAARELMTLGRQVLGSLIAEQVARREYENVKTQIGQSVETDEFLRSKFTSEELYGWMQGEISRLYYEYYRFAFDIARRAERTVKQEVMRPELDATDFVRFNYWDGGRKGLLSGEALYLDLRRLEVAYLDNNKRELELTRHISLRQLDPMALLTLKATGRCEFSIPEWFFDRDCPGHYMRRIKTVALSIPSVAGPYTSLNCTLSLLRSRTRTSPLLKEGAYGTPEGEDDSRFVDSFGSIQSIVTSGGLNDSGLFETNLRDERFLPFEGAGAISTWRLELPQEFPAFDYSTVADIILHVRYTARQGGELLGKQATAELRVHLSTANESGLAVQFSLRHDFPTEWATFATGTDALAIRFTKDHFPYMVQAEELVIDGLELFGIAGTTVTRREVGVPATMADEINAPNGGTDLSLAPDPQVLKRDAQQVHLVVRYSIV